MKTKIAFLSTTDPRDKGAWSGIHYYMVQYLEKHCGNVEPLGHIAFPLSYYAGGAFSRFSRKTLNKRFDYYHSISIAKAYAKIFNQKLKEKKFDFIFATPFTSPIAFLETDIPIVYCSDSVFSKMLDYYPVYSNLFSVSKKNAWKIEKLAFDKSRLLLFSSRWAANAAINDFNAANNKTFVIPMGANLDSVPPKEKIFSRKKNSECKLLFVGKEWERKGGDIAFETLIKLLEQNINASLTVCGCMPPKKFRHPKLHIIPYFDKNKPEDTEQLSNLYLNADFFILPTRAEAFGIVFCEASALGVPSLAPETGGVADAVHNGINGFLLPYNARGDAYAQIIANVLQDERKYYSLRESSRKLYEEKLNWNTWGTTVRKIIEENLFVNR